jgi:F420 biosynthesis protein FbiB-like protein
MVADALDTSRTEAVLHLVKQRRSTRHFREDPVPHRLLLEMLEAVQWAPSPHNSQPWRFTILSASEDKMRLATAMGERLRVELAEDGVPTEEIRRQSSRSRERIARSPIVLLCSLQADGLARYSDQRRNELEWQMAVQSVGAALQTLFLVAQGHGIGTCWMAAPMYCGETVRQVLNLPQDYEPQALVLMGYKARPGKVRQRRDLAAIVDFR